MSEAVAVPKAVPRILLVLTGLTGIVDAVSVLALGHVFTANMTGNIVFLGFALAGAPGLSAPRTAMALVCFAIGAAIGGRMASRPRHRNWIAKALTVEALLLLVAAAVALAIHGEGRESLTFMIVVIAITAATMGLRNAVVRKLNVPDLTTTVLTLTVTGLASDSSAAAGNNPGWQRRVSAITAMFAGAMAGAFMVRISVSLPLFCCSFVAAACAWNAFQVQPNLEGTW